MMSGHSHGARRGVGLDRSQRRGCGCDSGDFTMVRTATEKGQCWAGIALAMPFVDCPRECLSSRPRCHAQSVLAPWHRTCSHACHASIHMRKPSLHHTQGLALNSCPAPPLRVLPCRHCAHAWYAAPITASPPQLRCGSISSAPTCQTCASTGTVFPRPRPRPNPRSMALIQTVQRPERRVPKEWKKSQAQSQRSTSGA